MISGYWLGIFLGVFSALVMMALSVFAARGSCARATLVAPMEAKLVGLDWVLYYIFHSYIWNVFTAVATIVGLVSSFLITAGYSTDGEPACADHALLAAVCCQDTTAHGLDAQHTTVVLVNQIKSSCSLALFT